MLYRQGSIPEYAARYVRRGYDRILVEPSGIYDVDEFFEIMLTEPVKDCCEIGSILTIADARFR